MKITKNNPQYMRVLATYMNTRQGQAFALSIVSQLIDEFEVDHKGRITQVSIDDTQSIKLDLE